MSYSYGAFGDACHVVSPHDVLYNLIPFEDAVKKLDEKYPHLTWRYYVTYAAKMQRQIVTVEVQNGWTPKFHKLMHIDPSVKRTPQLLTRWIVKSFTRKIRDAS